MLWNKAVFCLEVLIYKRLQMWRHNDVISRNEYLISTFSQSTVPWVYSLQFLFKSIHQTWRYERKSEWVFFSEHSASFWRYLISNNISTLKSGSRVAQDHWKWHHSIYRIWLHIHVLYSNYGASSYRFWDITWYSYKFAISPIPPLVRAPLRRTSVKFPNNLRCAETRVLVWPCGENCMIVGLFL